MLKTERVKLTDWYKGIRETTKQLDETNIKILSAMWKHGPRNLLEVSRRTRIPFTSVYHRVGKLEAKSGRVAFLIPQVSKLGMVRVTLLCEAAPGCESKVDAALKIPNLWRYVNRSEGLFTHNSVHTVPVKFLKQFKAYVKRLTDLKLVTRSKIILTGDYIPNFPNFDYYSPENNQWRFEWSQWLRALRKNPSKAIEDPEGFPLLGDKKDVLITKELEKNARISFADLAPMLGISLQGVKYHYDKKLVPSGIVKHFAFEVAPYPKEISQYHEFMLRFTSKNAMNRFYSIVDQLFFVFGVSKVLRANELLVRTYNIQTQLPNMFAFLSQMANMGLLDSYSAVRLDFEGRKVQTISYELFDEQQGWVVDFRKCQAELSKLAKMAQVPERAG